MTNYLKIKVVLTIASIIISSLCWYVSNGLNGNFWYLLWIAPVPVLLISFNTTAKAAFFVSFIAYLIGRLSWLSYLITVATLVPAIVFTLAPALIFALTIILTRQTVIKTNAWYTIFAFPVFFTAFEWLVMRFSPDGTAASIAYSQLDFLPIIQIASITGILGITFIVTFIPSALALCWHYRKENYSRRLLSIVSLILIIPVFLFGVLRINNKPKSSTVMVGLATLDEKSHHMGNNLDFINELQHTRDYAEEITKLAAQGAKLVVLPERAINVNNETDSATTNILRTTAKQNHVAIVVGYTNFRSTARNSAWTISDQGNVLSDYNKNRLIKGLESQFVPGSEPGLFKFNDVQSGVAICKDLDFPATIKKYGVNNTTFLCIPAWDFTVDDWLHSRMAILRGVENGFSEVRTARLGRLTISDCYGRVNAEADASNGKSTTLLGKVSLKRIDTCYTRFGDWFGIGIMVTAVIFILILLGLKYNNS